MKAFFAADLHGKEKLYTQLGKCIEQEHPEIVIFGGDLFPEADNPKDSPSCQKEFIEKEFTSRLRKFHECGVKDILIIMGNHDLSISEKAVQEMEAQGLCCYIHDRAIELNDSLTFVGYSYSPPSPYILRDFDKKDSPDEEISEHCMLDDNKGYVSNGLDVIKINNWEFFQSRGTIQEDLAQLAEKINSNTIFVCHAPPVCKYLDMETPSLHVGSKAILEFIIKSKPRLSLHGHIHLSPKHSGRFLEVIKGVPCVQPGQNFDKLYGVFFDTDNPIATLRHTVLK